MMIFFFFCFGQDFEPKVGRGKEEVCGWGSGLSNRRGKKGLGSGEECGLLSREVCVREGVGGSWEGEIERGGEEVEEEAPELGGVWKGKQGESRRGSNAIGTSDKYCFPRRTSRGW